MIKANLLVGLYIFLIAFAVWSIWALVQVKILLPILFISFSYALWALGGCFLWDAIKFLIKRFKK